MWSTFHHTTSSWNEDVYWYPHAWLIKMASSKSAASKSRMMTQLIFLFSGHKTKPKTEGPNAKPLSLAPPWICFSWLQGAECKIQMQMLPSPHTSIFTWAKAKFSFMIQLCEKDCVTSSRPRESLPVLAMLLWELCNEGRLHPPAHRWQGCYFPNTSWLTSPLNLLLNWVTAPSRMKKTFNHCTRSVLPAPYSTKLQIAFPHSASSPQMVPTLHQWVLWHQAGTKRRQNAKHAPRL